MVYKMAKYKLSTDDLLQSIYDEEDINISTAQNRILLKIAYELEQIRKILDKK